MKTNGKRILLSALALTLTLGLAACGGKDEKKPASQVAVKVNAEEISVHQINFVLGRSGAGNVPPEQAPKVRREVLEKLVDQQLAVEQAIEKKLDRSPDVVMAIEAARREILARAYVEQITGAIAKPTAEEAKKYYSEHPQLFAERRVYNIQEIVLPASAGVASQLRDMIAAGKPIEEIANFLKNKDIKFSGGSATRSAEQIPLDLLPKVHLLKDGQGMIIDGAEATTVMRVVASQSAPVTEAAALPRIQQFLGNQRAGEAAASEFKQLKAKAKIVYQGEFGNPDGSAATPAPAKPAAPAAAKPAPAASTNIEKGVAGLK
jgi:EpsD family peptidyl-prolyl cis-trans isomerase